VTPVIGVLALQGDVVEHLQMLSARGARSVTVVAVRQGPLLAASFPPELTGDLRIHGLFADMVNRRS